MLQSGHRLNSALDPDEKPNPANPQTRKPRGSDSQQLKESAFKRCRKGSQQCPFLSTWNDAQALHWRLLNCRCHKCRGPEMQEYSRKGAFLALCVLVIDDPIALATLKDKENQSCCNTWVQAYACYEHFTPRNEVLFTRKGARLVSRFRHHKGDFRWCHQTILLELADCRPVLTIFEKLQMKSCDIGMATRGRSG